MVSDLQNQRDQEQRERKWNEQARERMAQHTGIKDRIREQVRQQEPERQPEPKPQAQPEPAAPPKRTFAQKLRGGIDKIDKKFDDTLNEVTGELKKDLKDAYNNAPRPKLPGSRSSAPKADRQDAADRRLNEKYNRALQNEKNKINADRIYREELAAYKQQNKPQRASRGYSEAPRDTTPSYASGIYSFSTGGSPSAPRKKQTSGGYNTENILSGNMSAISTMGTGMYYGASPPRRKTQPKTSVGSCKPCRPCKPCATKRKPARRKPAVKRKTTTRKRRTIRR
jgi:hypothetical protein